MRAVGKIIYYSLIAINAIVAALLVASGWSSYLYVSSFPIVSLIGMAFPAILAINLLFLLIWLIFWKRALWLPLLAIALTIKPILTYSPLHLSKEPAESEDGIIKILSYNTYYLNIFKIGKSGTDNPIINYVNQSGADIICLQESNSGALKNLINSDKDFLPDHKHSCHAVNMSTFSRWPIIEWKEIKFPDSGNCCLYSRILMGSDTIAVYNCHFQSFGLNQDEIDDYNHLIENPKDTASYKGSKSALRKLMRAAVKRAGQGEMIAEMIDKEDAGYILLCGDFNDTPLSYTHRIIAKRLTDVYAASGFGPGISYNRNRLYFRIDHTFCNKALKPMHCHVDKSIKDSDHYPEISYLRLQ